MNKAQWNIIGIFFMILSLWFVFLDNTARGGCDYLDDAPATPGDVVMCVKGEIYNPFILLLFFLGVVCQICAFLEPKRKKQ